MTSILAIRRTDALKQIDYRLADACGEQNASTEHAAVGYRLTPLRGQHPIERIGRGWAEFDHQAGTALVTEEDYEQVRRIMVGRHAQTGEQLIKPKVAAHPNALLPARAFRDALVEEAVRRGRRVESLLPSPAARERFARLERMLLRKGETHRAPVEDLDTLAEVTGVPLESVYDTEELDFARRHASERVEIGKVAHDLTITRDRSEDVLEQMLRAMGLHTMADHHRQMWMESAREGVRLMEEWASYGMAGHHGDGKRATKVESTGWAATITWHRTTRSIDDKIGDPHLHAHVLLPHMVHCPGQDGEPGKWRTPGAGGYDLYRHCETIDHYIAARHRRRMSREFGIRYAYNPAVREWQIVGIPPELRRHFSRRSTQIEAEAGPNASVQDRQRAGRNTAGKKIASTPAEEWEFWRRHTLQSGWVPQHIVRAVLGYEPPEDGLLPTGIRPPHQPDPDQVTARVWDPETGVTATDKAVPLTKVMAAVAEACPEGLESPAELARLTGTVTSHEDAIGLDKVEGGAHLSHNQRFTNRHIVEAERYIAAQAEQRLNQNTAVVPEPLTQAAIDAFALDKGYHLSAEQEQVVRRLVGAGHGIDSVVGEAGSGKTTVMDAAHRAWTSAGLRVHGSATAAVAAMRLRAASRIPSTTMAARLRDLGPDGSGLEGVDVLILEEGAMIDDLELKELVAEAERTGTKLVSIGDPQQQKAIGVGGAFARVHEIVDGLSLTENYRQTDPVERAALRIWRTGARATTLGMWAATGHIKATEDLSEAYAGMVASWWSDWSAHADVHDGIEGALMLAATNHDVAELNARARVLARHTDQLQGEDVEFWLRGGRAGERVEFAVGDLVRVRQNDYRDEGEDVLNGYRGRAIEVDARRGVHIEWREGGQVHQEWVDPGFIAQGGLSHGYALTIASAQGLTSSTCQVLALGANAHATYPAMSRVEKHSTLWVPAAELEPEDVQEALGPARTDEERLDRALAAFGPTLTDGDDTMITDEIDGRERAFTGQTSGPVLSVEQARAGQGPTMAEASSRIEELREAAQRAAQRVEELHAQLVTLNTELEGRRWRTKPLREKVDQVHTELDSARQTQQETTGEAQRIRDEAINADLVIARHRTSVGTGEAGLSGHRFDGTPATSTPRTPEAAPTVRRTQRPLRP